jgi:class 3 adenylate cyclase
MNNDAPVSPVARERARRALTEEDGGRRRSEEHPTLAGRLGNVTQWSSTDKVVLTASIVLPFHIAYAAVASYLLAYPEIAPYMDRAFVERVPFWITCRIVIPAWAVVLALAVALRRRSPENPWLVHASIQLFAVWVAFCAYGFGSHTAMYTSLTLIGAAVFNAVMFGTRAARLGVASFLTIITVTTVLEQMKIIPYAPMMSEPPISGRHLATSWLLGLGIVDVAALLVLLLLIFFLVDQWRSHQAKLADTSEQLAQANDLISRYVAQQVAEQIRLGNYAAIDRRHRRRLTLFFSDIEGFTEVADHIEAEELSDILNDYFAEMTAIAHRFGGTIDKFMGDAIMIFFGAPAMTDDRDHALRAVRMAMVMQTRIADLCQGWERRGLLGRFQIRIGINTGVASVGNFGAPGRMDYTAIGRQVNLAARLQVSCEPGKILLGHATWALVRDEIPCQPKGEIQVKGIRDPVKVYEVDTPYVCEDRAEVVDAATTPPASAGAGCG